MNFFHALRTQVIQAITTLQEEGLLPQDLDTSPVTVEPPRDASHGDVATNAALVLSKAAGKNPREIAQLIMEKLKTLPEVTACELAGPGFLNLRLGSGFWHARLKEVLASGINYGASPMGQGRLVNVEYVSTNPTGPMHIGHARGAIFGDALARLMAKAGYQVLKEFYVNDAGGQVQELARSAYARYLEALGEPFTLGQYGGDYLVPVGQALAKEHGRAFVGQDESAWLATFQAFAVGAMLDLIKQDLALLGVHHEVFTSEKALTDAGRVEEALETLRSMGLIYEGVLEPPKGKVVEDYEPRPQTLFKATDFGDDVDRPLKKTDGAWTYLAGDIAYHYDKYKRGANEMINVWGADHGGYVKRIAAAVTAITKGQAQLDVKLCQMVKFIDGGEAMKMSKRSGNFVTLHEAIELVGKDVLRFIMLTRKNDAPMDFDFAKVTEHSKDNPVFYVQYACARAHSILRHGAEAFPNLSTMESDLAACDVSKLTDEADLSLIKLLASWPRQVEIAAASHEPHRIAYYLYDVAAAFHGLWNKGKEETELRFINPDSEEETRVRLTLVAGTLTVLRSGLDVLGVEAVEELRS